MEFMNRHLPIQTVYLSDEQQLWKRMFDEVNLNWLTQYCPSHLGRIVSRGS